MSDNHAAAERAVERAAEAEPEAIKFAEVASGIYRRFDAPSVFLALRHAVGQQLFAENPTIMLMFVRIAEVYPAAREHLQAQLNEASGPELQAIELILNPPTEIRGAAYLPDAIESPGEMDLCWSEFLVTGKTDVVEKIVSVLDREDRSRVFLKTKLVDAEFELSEADRLELQQVGIGIGKLSESQGWEVMTPGDTDLFLWLGIKDQNQACLRVLQAMDDTLKLHLACKGAALWSLQANASQHGVIRLLCEQAAETPGGFGRQLLNPA
ncbi:MAG: hypothetical protein AB8B91_05245 [Rubripirellula sp.]